MSGLEALGAFGLSRYFTREVSAVARAILETSETPDAATSLANSMDNLAATTTEIQSSAGLTSQPPGPNNTRMLQIAQECSKAALELKAEIDKSSVASSSAT